MENIYKSPDSKMADGEEPNVSNIKRIICTFCVFPPALFYFLLTKIIPNFAEAFAAFGEDLPAPTIFVLKIYPIFMVFSLVSIVPLLIWLGSKVNKNIQRLLFNSSVINLLVVFVVFFFVMWTMYLPIFNLGASV